MAYISKLNIVNFISHSNFKENFKNNKNIVVIGPNGSGKTNLIESLNFFSNSKSIRGEKLTNLIKLDSEGRAMSALRYQVIGTHFSWSITYLKIMKMLLKNFV